MGSSGGSGSNVIKTKASFFQSVAIYKRSFESIPETARAVIEGVLLGSWTEEEYKTTKQPKKNLEKILLVFDEEPLDDSFLKDVKLQATVMADATNLARRWSNEPGNIVSPRKLAELARELAHETQLDIEIWDEKKIEKVGMNAILAVAKGSEEPARLIILRHWGAPNRDDRPSCEGQGNRRDNRPMPHNQAAA